MSFDGEYKRESPKFEEVDGAWEYSGDLGSKWYFYPFHFVVSGNKVVDTPQWFDWAVNRRIDTVTSVFKHVSDMEHMQNADIDTFTCEILKELDGGDRDAVDRLIRNRRTKLRKIRQSNEQ